jgi:hypothetical protein
MITLFILPLILVFSPAAVWALRVGGLRRLWLLCALTLLAFLLVAIFLSAAYSVPSVWRVIVYSLAFVRAFDPVRHRLSHVGGWLSEDAP